MSTSTSDLLRDTELRVSIEVAINDSAKRLEERTHFNFEECVELLRMHAQITEKYPLKIKFFRHILGSVFNIKNNFMLSRIHFAFDRDANGVIDGDEWLISLSSFMRGEFDEQIEFSFSVYDINGDGALEREELSFFLADCLMEGEILNSEEVEEGTKEIVDMLMKKLDVNGDGAINFSDFKDACYKDPLLLQSCGLFMPASKYIRTFGAIFTPNYDFYTPCYDDTWVYKKNRRKSRAQTVIRANLNPPPPIDLPAATPQASRAVSPKTRKSKVLPPLLNS